MANASEVKTFEGCISQPIEMIELLSSGNLVLGTNKPVADIDCHPGTPIVLTFSDYCVVLTCESNSQVNVQKLPKNFDCDDLFRMDPILYDQERFAARIPLVPFLSGPHIDCLCSDYQFIDAITLISRRENKLPPVLAAVVLTFHGSIQFGVSAVRESHFCYCFNEHCRLLVAEATASPKHVVLEISRPDSVTREAGSMLWMVE